MIHYDQTFQAHRPGLRQLRHNIDGVADATVSFMTQRMTVDADEARFEQIMDQIVAVCKKVEPDCQIVRK